MAWENCNVVRSRRHDDRAWCNTCAPRQVGRHHRRATSSPSTRNTSTRTTAAFSLRQERRSLDAKTPDIITSEYYPHWEAVFSIWGTKPRPQTFSKHAATITAMVRSMSWTNSAGTIRTGQHQARPGKSPHAMKNEPKISGDLFWALQAHNIDFGWQPIPANVPHDTRPRQSG